MEGNNSPVRNEGQKKSDDFEYIVKGLDAEDHTPVYKMHKYFARRPQNVFRNLIDTYSEPGDIILDCFCGGGVTLFEGISINRKVVAVDVNPLATFVSDCQTTRIPVEKYLKVMGQVHDAIYSMSRAYYSTTCRKCGKEVDVRWFELAYLGKCPNKDCGKNTSLSNDNKASVNGKVVDGKYSCQHCKSSFKAVDIERVGHNLISVTYRCDCSDGRQTVPPNDDDRKKFDYFEEKFEELIEKHNLWYPEQKIPLDWDRQKEDCLSRKGIINFSDFFTKRSLFFNAVLFNEIRKYKRQVDDELYKMLVFTFSAIIRYTNNLTISTGSWMDGRPVAWAKHAFWISNQFVEVNPIEYVEKRTKAISAGLTYQKVRFSSSNIENIKEAPSKIRKVQSFNDLVSGKGSHIIWTQSSDTLSIPDNSVDLVLTDPPYGSNVQYGELSAFWLVWLTEELKLESNCLGLDNEILVHRKKSVNGKDYNDYYQGLLNVFRECYRVLKPGRALAFTFNNKDMLAWFAVVKAAINAGFHLDDKGIIYQGSINNYDNTAHARFEGALHGDYIYTFRKVEGTHIIVPTDVENGIDVETLIIATAKEMLTNRSDISIDELYSGVLARLIPMMISRNMKETAIRDMGNHLSEKNMCVVMSRNFRCEDDGRRWRLD